MAEGVELRFSQGTLLGAGDAESIEQLGVFLFDKRTLEYRAKACSYREIVLKAQAEKIPLVDLARSYKELPLQLLKPIIPRRHQEEALEAWLREGKTGVVSLPTGAGKTIFALMCMERVARSTLVVVPTIDLMWQWHSVLKAHFTLDIGLMGGGQRDVRPVTIATYDSARMIIESQGHTFGFLIIDECHHLPAPQYQIIGEGCLAPFRLGLSATLERADGKESVIYELLGKKVFEGTIGELVENTLSPYDVVSIEVDLSEDEKERYAKARQKYVSFIRKAGIDYSQPDGWKQFIMRSARSPEGKEAMTAYREQKKLAQAAASKLDEVWKILSTHTQDPLIIFTDDNEMAYQIGSMFVLAVLTHKTKPKERQKMLNAFRAGELRALVTSKVLNEGVDVPEASVGVVVSGSGAVREHVQRLGRILRHRPGKRATLYEIIAKNTSEKYVNERRRQHYAYKKSP